MTSRSLAILPGLRRGLLALGLLLAPVVLAADKNATFDVPAGDAAVTLKQFAEQSGQAVVYMVDAVRGVQTKAVKGSLAPREALEQLLAGSKLHAVADEKTGALSVTSNGKNGQGAVPPIGNRPGRVAKNEDGALVLEEVEVTGSRIRQASVSEAGVSPLTVFTRKEIERTSASTLGDFLTRNVTQNFQQTALEGTGLTSSELFSTNASTSLNLRGLGNNTTLILINGRRLPKSGQAFGRDGYDLGAIPLGAVERIDVLTDGASAIYGADAIGGVVNIVLRKNYVGIEATASYGNVFKGDAAEQEFTLTAGVVRDRLQVIVSASYYHLNPLGTQERYFTRSDDRRDLGGGDRRVASRGGRGSISSTTAANLPGLPSTLAGIPAGQDGRSLTIASFLPTAGFSEALDSAPYRDVINENQRHSVIGSFEWGFRPWATFFGNAGFNETRSVNRADPPNIAGTVIPAANAFNPFGVPVRIFKGLDELGNTRFAQVRQNPTASLGVRGSLPAGLRYEAGASWTRNRGELDFDLARVLYGPRATPALNSSDRSTAVNFFNDSLSTNGNPPGFLESLLFQDGHLESGDTYTGDLKVDGELWQLSSGSIRFAVGSEYRKEEVEFAPSAETLLTTLRNTAQREVSAVFAEIAIPVFGQDRAPAFFNKLELQLAARLDEYSDFGRATNPRYGALYRPFKWLALRGSYGEGFKTPTLNQLYSTVFANNRTFVASPALPSAFDPVLNQPILGTIFYTSGGNPNLNPETSISRNFGVVIDVPGLAGLSITADYFDVNFRDRVGNVSDQDIVTFFPNRLIRDTVTNRITAIDARAVNFAFVRTSGWDLRASYRRATAHGTFDWQGLATHTERYEQASTPTTPVRVLTSERPLRLTSSLFWNKGPWESGITVRYIEGFDTRFFFNTKIGSAIEWDWQASYDFAKGRQLGSRMVEELLRNTRVSIDVANLFDRVPPPTDGRGGFASTDPRMARYRVKIQKKF